MLHLLPVVLVVADLLAVGADGQDALQLADLGEQLAQVLVGPPHFNRPPVVAHQPDVKLGTTGTLLVTTNASDPDPGDVPTFSYSITPPGLTLSQGTGAQQNQLTLTAPPGGEGTYTVTVTVTDRTDATAKQATDAFRVKVTRGQSLQVAGGGVQPLISDGVLLYDSKHAQLVAFDALRNPSQLYRMALLADPSQQVWTLLDFTGCSSEPCFPPTGGYQGVQAVMDTTRGALFLSLSFGPAVAGAVWRLELDSGAGRVLLFGGAGRSSGVYVNNELFAFDLAQRPGSSSAPTARCPPAGSTRAWPTSPRRRRSMWGVAAPSPPATWAALTRWWCSTTSGCSTSTPRAAGSSWL